MNFALYLDFSFLGLKSTNGSCSNLLLTKSFIQESSYCSCKKKMVVCSHLMPGHLEGSFMGEKRFEEAPRKLGFVRTLLVDNYDSYTYNIYQELSVVNGVPPVVVKNDEWTWEQVCYYLYEEKAFDNIVNIISPGPGSPTCATDIGICLRLLLECRDIPILGVCLGYQALGYVHGAQVVHASEPVHGGMSEIEYNGCKHFNNIPSGPNAGFKVVRYHSLVIDEESLPEDLVPIAWTTSAGIHSFLESQSSDTWSYSLSEEVQMKKIIVGIKHSTRPHYGLQFHPESIATCHGRQIFENFREMTQNHWQRLRSTFVNERNAIYAAASSKKEKRLPGIAMEIYHQLPKTFPVRVVHPSPRKSRSFSFTVTNSKYKTESEDRNRMFILGMGYVGQVFARNLRNEDWMVTGTSTSTAKKEELKERGFDICLFDTNEPQLSTLNTLKSCTHLLVSIPSVVGVGDPLLQHDELLRSTLLDGNLQWLCYLSSTSVYGDCGGAWVNEDYSTSPTSETAKARLAAEEGWINLGTSLGISTQIFRLGGIYGPGRSAIDTIIKQEPVSRSQKMRISKKYTSRVHVDDICQALKASIHRLPFRRIYNIVDDDPAPRDEVFAYARELVEKKWPTWAEHNTFTEKAISYNRRGEKRVSNDRMKKELGVRLLHPSYKSGLLNIIDQMEYPSSEK